MQDISELFDLVQAEGASDLLLTAGAPPMIRVHGNLKKTENPNLTPDDVKKMVFSLLNEKQRFDFEENKELDFSLGLGSSHRFRVNIYYQKGCVAASFRPIPSNIPELNSLGLPPLVYDLSLKPQGLILVTGPTGHGKSTTLASMIDLVNSSKRCHIITIEDPIEYLHRNKNSVIDQREIGGDTHTFKNALKYVLRQDPDVILIGEMRDWETIAAALTAAETGHLVLATLHTNDAVQTINRIIDVFHENQQQQIRVQLSMTLLAVVSQRLIPKVNEEGRALAVEILRNNHASAALIREQKTHQIYSVIETGTKEGMVTMDASLIRLYKEGFITSEEASMHMRNPHSLLEVITDTKKEQKRSGSFGRFLSKPQKT